MLISEHMNRVMWGHNISNPSIFGHFLRLVLVLLCFFPWVSFGLLKMDLQPYFIALAIMYLIACRSISLPIEGVFFFSTSIISLTLALADGYFDFLSIRAVIMTLAFALVFSAFYMMLKYGHLRLIRNCLVWANIIWLIAALIQDTVSPRIFEFVVDLRTTLDRGVTGLAPEPTFFGTFLVLFSWLLLKIDGYKFLSWKTSILHFLNILSILILAKSSMALVILICSCVLYLTTHFFEVRKAFIAVFVVAGFLGLSSLFNESLEGSRLQKLYGYSEVGLFYVVQKDASANSRLKHMVFPIHGAVTDSFMPHGYHQFSETTRDLKNYYGNLFWYGKDSSKVMSGIGSLLYELGFFSFIFVVGLCISLCRAQRLRRGLFELGGLVLIMFTAVPLALPMFAIFCAVSSYSGIYRNRARQV